MTESLIFSMVNGQMLHPSFAPSLSVSVYIFFSAFVDDHVSHLFVIAFNTTTLKRRARFFKPEALRTSMM